MAVYTATYPIHTYEADPQGKATFPALFRFLQDIAADHATSIGYGLDDLRQSSNMWVLSRFLFRARRVPRWRETLRIDTWPSGTERIFALRDWLVSDEEGQEVAIATSGWVVVDIHKRTPVRVEKVAERMDMIVDRHLFDRSPGKIPAFESAEPSYETRASFADMDLNGHVNATRYVEWMFEGLPSGLREEGWEPSEVEVNFTGESRSGDEIAVFTEPHGWPPEDSHLPAGRAADSTPTPRSGPAGGEPLRAPSEVEFLHSVVKKSEVLCRARTLWRAPVATPDDET